MTKIEVGKKYRFRVDYFDLPEIENCSFVGFRPPNQRNLLIDLMDYVNFNLLGPENRGEILYIVGTVTHIKPRYNYGEDIDYISLYLRDYTITS
jgi:hypothetical protein